jgi:hypothetical protein
VKNKKLAFLLLLAAAFRVVSQAQIQHVEMRVERHDLKLLSLRGEATPRAPVWRSKRGSQFDRWKAESMRRSS